MGVDLSTFASNIATLGVSHGNRYTVRILDGFREKSHKVAFTEAEMAMCVQVNVPSVSFNTFGLQNLQPVIRIPWQVLFEPLQMDFIQFDNGYPYKRFTDWQRAMFGDGARLQDYNFFAEGKKISVQELSKSNDIVQTHMFYNCYPNNITKSLAYDTHGQALRFSVGFMYEYSEVF